MQRLVRLVSILAALPLLAASAVAQINTRVSVDSAGRQNSRGVHVHSKTALSADGRFAAFVSGAPLVADDTNNTYDLFVHDLSNGTTERVNLDSSGRESSAVATVHFSISADGRYVAFDSASNALVPGDQGFWDVFVRDRSTGETTRVSVDSAGVAANVSSIDYLQSRGCSISGSGRFVAFYSFATNLDAAGIGGVFVHDRQTGSTTRVSVGSGSAPMTGRDPVISSDGRFVAFLGLGLLTGESSTYLNVYVHDAETGATVRASPALDGEPNYSCSHPSISRDGRFVSFESLASNLVANDTNGLHDVFVTDMSTRLVERASVDSSGTQGNDHSVDSWISANGRFVAFSSWASNLVAGDSNGTGSLGEDVFVRDLLVGTTTRVSTAADGTQANAFSREASISEDGRYVAFTSPASNLVPDDTNQNYDAFVRDRVRLQSVLPASGSEAGGDLVNLDVRFLPVGDGSVVRFGGADATIVAASPSRVQLRTPPGAGIVDVSVTTPGGSVSRTAIFGYVAPDLAARFGDVNVGRGDREDVLLVNASRGNDRREARLALGEAMTLVMQPPSSRPSAHFVLYAWTRVPSVATLTPLPRGVGSLVMPAPFTGGSPQPRAIWNNAGHRRTLGSPTYPSRPAPSVVVRATNGFTIPARVALQGLIEDDASASPVHWSVTNAILLTVWP
ncbi:MAG: hypothetical protein HYR85_28155 [Planctomycetes bacterium]|nr:hypothetical protein [Planctomycetota bacterium]